MATSVADTLKPLPAAAPTSSSVPSAKISASSSP